MFNAIYAEGHERMYSGYRYRAMSIEGVAAPGTGEAARLPLEKIWTVLLVHQRTNWRDNWAQAAFALGGGSADVTGKMNVNILAGLGLLIRCCVISKGSAAFAFDWLASGLNESWGRGMFRHATDFRCDGQ